MFKSEFMKLGTKNYQRTLKDISMMFSKNLDILKLTKKVEVEFKQLKNS